MISDEQLQASDPNTSLRVLKRLLVSGAPAVQEAAARNRALPDAVAWDTAHHCLAQGSIDPAIALVSAQRYDVDQLGRTLSACAANPALADHVGELAHALLQEPRTPLPAAIWQQLLAFKLPHRVLLELVRRPDLTPSCACALLLPTGAGKPANAAIVRRLLRYNKYPQVVSAALVEAFRRERLDDIERWLGGEGWADWSETTAKRTLKQQEEIGALVVRSALELFLRDPDRIAPVLERFEYVLPEPQRLPLADGLMAAGHPVAAAVALGATDLRTIDAWSADERERLVDYTLRLGSTPLAMELLTTPAITHTQNRRIQSFVDQETVVRCDIRTIDDIERQLQQAGVKAQITRNRTGYATIRARRSDLHTVALHGHWATWSEVTEQLRYDGRELATEPAIAAGAAPGSLETLL